jgi:hypothetical protein
MSGLKSKVGKRSGAFQDKITSLRITDFCRAIGVPESRVAPPTFLTVFRKGEFTLFQELGIELSRVLHTQQEFEYAHPIAAGDLVRFETEICNVLEKNRTPSPIQFITLQTEFHVERESESLFAGKSTTTIVVR